MLIAPHPTNEEARLRLLRSLGVLDTPPEEDFDRITRVCAELLQVPITLVSLVDENRQWFKSKIGLEVCETSRDVAFCAHALHVQDILLIKDATQDPRFSDNPLVVGSPHIRFYAGVPLRSDDGLVLGTLCAIDTRPRDLTAKALAAFKDLARVVERDLLHRSAALDMRAAWEGDRQAKVLSEARFALVFQQTPSGKAIVDLQGRFNAVNPKLCAITGYSEDELLKLTFAAITHPDDLEKDLLHVADLLFGRSTTYAMEKRYIRRDGSLVWVEINVSLVRTEQGEPDHFIAVILDITDRKRGEEVLHNYQEELESKVVERTRELTASRETLQAIADNMPILIAHVDRDLRYLFNNDVYRQVFGIDPATLRGKYVKEVLDPELFSELLPNFQRALAGERVVHDGLIYNLEQGRIWTATYVPDVRNGEVVGFYVMSQDVTDRTRVERNLRDKAMLDPLTELPNRRALHEHLEHAVGNAVRSPEPFALFFLDLDGFKAVNDQHGHDAGDELLKQVATRLEQTVRKGDFVCRLAGDEFVVVAHGVPNPETAGRIAENLCEAIATPFALSLGAVKIGTSLGIALSPPTGGVAAASLLTQADNAMYEAKRRGRNGYRFASGD
ncbi:MAG: diguanylate cyclase domain-containing protein [Janthinobacterium lividum]